MAAPTETREQEIRNIWRKYSLFYKLLGAALLIGIGALLGRLIYSTPEADQAWGYGVNIYTSVISTAITVLILDVLNRRDSRKDALRELKRQLVDDAASISNEIAKNAVHQIRRKRWLMGETSLLRRADLAWANLQDADLRGANMQDTDFMEANLQNADFRNADLRGAALIKANLSGANLSGAQLQSVNLQEAHLENAKFMSAHLEHANLQGAHLSNATLELAALQDANLEKATLNRAVLYGAKLQRANLRDAQLEGVNFSQANLEDADLSGAELYGAIFDGTQFSLDTWLPYGKRWTPYTDMRAYTAHRKEPDVKAYILSQTPPPQT